MRLSLLGSSSGRNAGDAALMRAIVDAVRGQIPDAHFEIPTISPRFIRASYRPEEATPVPLFPWNGSIKFLGLPVFRSVARCDAVIVFDAVLFDRSLWNPLFNYLSTLRFALPWARRHGRPVIFYDVGVGPVTTTTGRRFLRKALEAGDLFTFRDPDSWALAREVGLPPGRTALLTADAAFDHQPAPPFRVDEILREVDLPPEGPRVGVNVNAYLDSWAPERAGRLDRVTFVRTLAELADRMAERWQATVVFFVTQHMDVAITRSIVDAMRRRSSARILSNATLAPGDLQGAMGRMELFFGMRLHSLILALSQVTPVVGLVYQSKVASLFSQIDRPAHAIPFRDFDVDTVWAVLDRAWSRRADERRELAPTVAGLRERAAEAAVRTAALLRSRAPR